MFHSPIEIKMNYQVIHAVDSLIILSVYVYKRPWIDLQILISMIRIYYVDPHLFFSVIVLFVFKELPININCN